VDIAYYGRLLRQQGVNLARAPRTLEPETGSRWLYVWNSREEAQAFAQKLKKASRDKNWCVLPVSGAVSEGPLGPVELQMAIHVDGWVFELHPLTRAMLRTLFPEAEGTELILVRSEARPNRTGEKLHHLVRQVLPILTGLPMEQLEPFGYRVSDFETDKAYLLVPPRDACQEVNGLPAQSSRTEQRASNRV